jgi:hypothetical protein
MQVLHLHLLQLLNWLHQVLLLLLLLPLHLLQLLNGLHLLLLLLLLLLDQWQLLLLLLQYG